MPITSDLNLIAEKDIGSAIFRLYEEGIYHVIVRKGEKVTMEFVSEGYAFLDSHGAGRYFNIYQFDSFSEVDPEVRDWMAAPPVKSYTYADAIVISSFPQKIIADFYIRWNKPVNPTRIFHSADQAFNWVFTLMSERATEDQAN